MRKGPCRSRNAVPAAPGLRARDRPHQGRAQARAAHANALGPSRPSDRHAGAYIRRWGRARAGGASCGRIVSLLAYPGVGLAGGAPTAWKMVARIAEPLGLVVEAVDVTSRVWRTRPRCRGAERAGPQAAHLRA